MNKKKILSGIMAIALVSSSMILQNVDFNAGADDSVDYDLSDVGTVNDSGTISIGEEQLKISGDTVEDDTVVKVPVSIKNNPGFATADLYHELTIAPAASGAVASYVTDGTKLVLDAGDLTTDKDLEGAATGRFPGKVMVVQNDAANITGDGVIYYVEITVPAGAKVGDKFDITFNRDGGDFELYNNDDMNTAIIPELVDGYIEIVKDSDQTTIATTEPTTTTIATTEPTTTTIATTESTTTAVTTTEPTTTAVTTTEPTTTAVTTTEPSSTGTVIVDTKPSIDLKFSKDSVKKGEEFTVTIIVNNLKNISSFENLNLFLKYNSSCAECIESNGWIKSATEKDTLTLYTDDNSVNKFELKFKALKDGSISVNGFISGGKAIGDSGTLQLEEVNGTYVITTTTTTSVEKSTTVSNNNDKSSNTTSVAKSNGTTTVEKAKTADGGLGDKGVLPYLLAVSTSIIGALFTYKKNKD